MQEAQIPNKVYLPGLLGLRFLAAFSVFFGHMEQAKSWVQWSAFELIYNRNMADDGVTLFFVLSGFLITYLLLLEKQKFGQINVKQFYKRRILRLWPLYYLFTIIVFFVIPQFSFLSFPNLDNGMTQGPFWERLGLFVFMSPHIAILLFAHPGTGGPLWSVGVEEYFYFVWPHLLQRFKRALPLVFGLMIVIPVYLRIEGPPFYPTAFFRVFFSLCRLDCLAWGGLGAWAYLNFPKVMSWIFSIPAQLVIYFFAIKQLLYITNYGVLEYSIYSIIFLGIILNVSMNPKSILKLENRFFRFMGEISYGFYVFQWISNVICINAITALGGIKGDTARSIVLLIADFALTTALASASYFWWEKRFLVLKYKKHSVILVGAGVGA
jgi:peptidoglycan/LPS O-acetylase OafA/YrhL